MSVFWRALIGLLAIAAVVSLVMLWGGSGPVGSENLVGMGLPDFAAPLAAGTREGDANIYTRDQARAVDSVPACDVTMSGVFNSCRDLKGNAVLNFWNTKKPGCVAQVEALSDFARQNQNIAVAAVAFDQAEGEVREFLEATSVKLDVPIDRDGAVAGLYAVAGCPTTYFIRDGRITSVRLGDLSEAVLKRGTGGTSGGGATGGGDEGNG